MEVAGEAPRGRNTINYNTLKVAIIGGGAAGCFAAIHIKRMMPEADVTVFEAGKRLLAKVAITGGGRCNLTNSFAEVKSIASVYPRGERLMKRLLQEFSHEDTFEWFEREGVRLVTQDDQCVFPQSQNAMEIVDTLTRLMRQLGVKVKLSSKVQRIVATEDGSYNISVSSTSANPPQNDSSLFTLHSSLYFDFVLVTTGGSPRISGLSFLDGLNLEMVEPVPSLFSLCIPDDGLKSLMGTVVEEASVSIPGTKLRASGALLITHWGVSGPAVLRLSSYAARILNDKEYKSLISVNWCGDKNDAEIAEELGMLAAGNMQKKLSTITFPSTLTRSLWLHLLSRAGLHPGQRWGELGKKSFNRLASVLSNDTYTVNGKNRFKEEFVTCGGVALGNINPKTLECRTHPRLFFAGEVLDVDAVTGGFNLQAAWTMGYVAATGICQNSIKK